MTKEEMKEWLRDTLKSQGTPIKKVLTNDSLDAIILKAEKNERFILQMDYLMGNEEFVRLHARRNPELLAMQLAILKLQEIHIEEAESYVAGIFAYADSQGQGNKRYLYIWMPVNLFGRRQCPLKHNPVFHINGSRCGWKHYCLPLTGIIAPPIHDIR